MTIIFDGTLGITSPGGDTSNTSHSTPIVRSPSSLTLQTNGSTTAVTIDTSQNVGIGTSSPAGAAGRNLTIYNSSGQSRLALKNSVTGDGANDGFQVGIDGDGIALLDQRENFEMRFSTNATTRMTIASTGLVSTTGSITSGGYVVGGAYYRSSGMVNETVTVTTEATVYSMNKDSGSGGSSSTSTYNITGLPNTDGSWAIIYIRNSNTAPGINTVQIVQIHGTKVWEGNVQNTTKTASFLVFRQNGSWQTTAWATGAVMNNVW